MIITRIDVQKEICDQDIKVHSDIIVLHTYTHTNTYIYIYIYIHILHIPSIDIYYNLANLISLLGYHLSQFKYSVYSVDVFLTLPKPLFTAYV